MNLKNHSTDVPIAMLSAKTVTPEVRASDLHWLKKPFTPNDILEAINLVGTQQKSGVLRLQSKKIAHTPHETQSHHANLGH